jgi:predicted MFS family arabinose efflux permease
MALGRICGDALNRRIGARRLLRLGATLAAVSLAAMLAVGDALVALPALALAGLGVANGVPLLFSAAGRIRDMPPGPALAAVSTMSYLGLLAGPPLLGMLAGLTSLPAALSVTAALTATVAVLAGRAEAGPR